MLNATCPSCKQGLTSLNGSATDVAFELGGAKFRTIVFICPRCRAVLGTQIDPIALKNDIVNETVTELKKVLGS